MVHIVSIREIEGCIAERETNTNFFRVPFSAPSVAINMRNQEEGGYMCGANWTGMGTQKREKSGSGSSDSLSLN